MFEDLTMYQAFLKAKKQTPYGVAIYYEGKKITYQELDKLICRTAAFLTSSLDIKPNDVILISEPNIPESLILLYAINKIGAVSNLVHPFTPYNQLILIYEKTKSKVAFVFEQSVALEIEKYRKFPYPLFVVQAKTSIPFYKRFIFQLFFNKESRKVIKQRVKDFEGFHFFNPHKLKNSFSPTIDDKKDNVAIILHSGSTTGDPKTICLTNYNFNATAELAAEILCLSKKEIRGKAMLSVLPNFHGFGLCMTMHSPIVNCFAAVLIPKFNVKAVINALNKTKNIISICGVPKIYESLTSSPQFWKCSKIKKLHVCFTGGDSINFEILTKFNENMREKGYKCRLFEGYGLSESTSVISVSTFVHTKYDSVGFPLRGVEIKIFDESYHELAKNEIGEIGEKSFSNMIGYYVKENTYDRTCFHNDFLLTGDLGFIDGDGFLHFISRKKRVIKVSGVATFPNEVEKLIKSIPGVKDVCVIGIDDEILKHSLKAFVVSDLVDKEELRVLIFERCKKYLIKWAVPKYIEFIDSIPKTLMQKNDYRKLEKKN